MAERLFGFAAGNLLAIFTIVSIAASISAMVLAGPRVYFAMARDGLFFRAPLASTRASARPSSPSSRKASGAACSCSRARCRSW